LPDTPGSTSVPEEIVLLMELLETTPIRAEQVKNWTKRTHIIARVLTFTDAAEAFRKWRGVDQKGHFCI
jgi:hypothetical protein